LILIPFLSFGAQSWSMHPFVLKHAIHGLREVLNAIVDRAILRMMDQAVEDMMMEDPCSQNLGNMGGFHPGDKVFFDGWAEIKGNIVKDHKSRKGFCLLL